MPPLLCLSLVQNVVVRLINHFGLSLQALEFSSMEGGRDDGGHDGLESKPLEVMILERSKSLQVKLSSLS